MALRKAEDPGDPGSESNAFTSMPGYHEAGGYRRYAGGEIRGVARLLFAGDLVPHSLWRQRFLLHSGTRETFGALSRLAGHVFVPAFLPKDYGPPLARGGSGQWLEMVAQMRSRSLTYRLMKQVDLSIVLSQYNRADAEKIFSKNHCRKQWHSRSCPDFDKALLPRDAQGLRRVKNCCRGRTLTPKRICNIPAGILKWCECCILAHCTAKKGLFDTVAGVAQANQRLRERKFPVSLRLFVAGTFVLPEGKGGIRAVGANARSKGFGRIPGFASGREEAQAVGEADLFCFPTYYENENQPVNLIEAMAFGLPILTTRWRSLPELFPPDYPGLVDICHPNRSRM